MMWRLITGILIITILTAVLAFTFRYSTQTAELRKQKPATTVLISEASKN